MSFPEKGVPPRHSSRAHSRERMEKDAARIVTDAVEPHTISVATVVAMAPVAPFKDWVTEFETAYNQLVDLEDNNLAIPEATFKTLQRDTAPVFRRIYGAYARAICALPVVREALREEAEDGDADM